MSAPRRNRRSFPGVAAREQERHGVRMTVVKITSAEGEQALGKPARHVYHSGA